MKLQRQVHSKKPTIEQAIDSENYEAEDGETLHYITTDASGQHWAHISIDNEEEDEEEHDNLQDGIIAMAEDAHILSNQDEDEEIQYATDELLIWGVTDLNAMSHDEQKKRTMWSDGTGPYPTTSSDDTKLAMLFVLNGYVHLECIKNNSAQEQVRALENAINFFIDRNQHIARQVLDNLCPAAVTDLLRRKNIPFHNVPANNHRYNRAEPAVGLFKNRFISMRAGLDPRYPIATEWHRLVPRVEVALNITIPSLKD
jgi:DNA-binding protein YbaB